MIDALHVASSLLASYDEGLLSARDVFALAGLDVMALRVFVELRELAA